MDRNKLREEVYEAVALEVEAGFYDRQTLINRGVDRMLDPAEATDTYVDWLYAEIEMMVDELIALHKEDEVHWFYTTDCDRLDEAFAELDRKGIVARHNFGCCQSCGHTDVVAEIQDTEKHRNVRGYVFYHRMDVDTVMRGRFLYLAHGVTQGSEEVAGAIANEIVDTLRRHGLKVEWDGSIRHRILIRPIVWQRRRAD